MTLRVAVIGSGIIGALTAIECLHDGHEVVLIDSGPIGGEQAASYGNGAWINSATVLPISMPGLWRKVPGYLLDRLGPFSIRWKHLPRAMPWLMRFVAAGSTWEKVEITARARRALVCDTVELYRAVTERTGLTQYFRETGLLHVWKDRKAFDSERRDWAVRKRHGAVWQELSETQLRQMEPGLAKDYKFGLLLLHAGHLTDPGAFVNKLSQYAKAAGATLIAGQATGFGITNGRLDHVLVAGAPVKCDRAVICAGARSAELAATIGDHVPLESERGYHIVLSKPDYVPNYPVLVSDAKFVVTMTDAGLRAAGQVEIGGLAAAPDWRRSDILLKHLQRVFPEIVASNIRQWMGHRPSTPDGLPSLGRSQRCGDIFHAFGHGHSGIAMGPRSARLVADLVSGKSPSIDPVPYSPSRFGAGSRL